MKLADIHLLGLSAKTRDNLYIDPVRAVLEDEWNRKTPAGTSYRTEAINRLATDSLPIRSECNIAWDVMKRYVVLICPYCAANTNVRMEMLPKDGSGSGDSVTQNWECPACKGSASLTVRERDLSFQAK